MWIIIYDHFDNKNLMWYDLNNTIVKDNLSTYRDYFFSGNWLKVIPILKSVFPHQFRLYDDDGTWCLTGYMDDASLKNNDVFDIIDIGMVQFGCTTMKYEMNGELHLL